MVEQFYQRLPVGDNFLNGDFLLVVSQVWRHKLKKLGFTRPKSGQPKNANAIFLKSARSSSLPFFVLRPGVLFLFDGLARGAGNEGGG